MREILQDHNEKSVSVLGERFLNYLDADGEPRHGVLVLSDKRLYQLGPSYEPDQTGGYRKVKGRHVIPIAELTDLGFTEKPVAKWVYQIGLALFVIGLGILIAGLIDGSGVGLALGLFIGAVWMVVPGVLMLFHSKTGGERYMDIASKDDTLSISCRPYAPKELETFKDALSAVIGK